MALYQRHKAARLLCSGRRGRMVRWVASCAALRNMASVCRMSRCARFMSRKAACVSTAAGGARVLVSRSVTGCATVIAASR